MTKEATTRDWRETTMEQIRTLIKQADSEIVEEVKYKTPSNPAGVPVWYCDGMICTGETYKQHLRLSFAKGPLLKDYDPKGLINTYRAIVLRESDELNGAAFVGIIRAAVAINRENKKKSKPRI